MSSVTLLPPASQNEMSWQNWTLDSQSKRDLLNAIGYLASRGYIKFSAPSNCVEGDFVDVLSQISADMGIPIHQTQLRPGWHKSNHGEMLVLVPANNGFQIRCLVHERGNYWLIDPQRKRKTKLNRQLANSIVPIGWNLVRTFGNAKSNALDYSDRPIHVFELLKYCWQTIRKYANLVLVSLAASIFLSFVGPLAFRQLVDSALPVADLNLVLSIGALLLILNLAEGLIVFSTANFALIGRSLATQSVQESLWNRILELPASFFHNRTGGELVHQSMLVSSISAAFGTNLLRAGAAGLVALASGVLAVVLSPILMLYAAPLAIVEAIILAGLVAKIRKRKYYLESVRAKVTGKVANQLTGIVKLQSSGTVFAAAEETHQLNEKAILEDEKIQFLEDTRGLLSIALRAASLLVIFSIGGSGALLGGTAASVGTFLAFVCVYRTFASGVSGIANLAAEVVGVREQLRLIEPFLNAVPTNYRSHTKLENLLGAVEFKNVTFRYEGNPKSGFQDVSFHCPAGQFIGFVGESGSGKSTVIRLLTGLENCEQGEILIDDFDIQSLNLHQVRKQFGVLQQGSKLVNGTIRENILAGRRFTDDQVLASLATVELRDFVEKLPLGLETPIVESGANVSGGQAQRLLLARTLIHSPKILIFDESFSGLDHGQQQRILKRIRQQSDATLVVISHSIALMKDADTIYRMESGRLSELGNDS